MSQFEQAYQRGRPYEAGYLIALDLRTGKTPTAVRVMAEAQGLQETWYPMAAAASKAEVKFRPCSAPHLIVAPSPDVGKQWVGECKAWGMGVGEFLVNEPSLAAKLASGLQAGCKIFVVTWQAIRDKADCLARFLWAGIVGDEAHVLGNWSSLTTEAAMRLDGVWRLALSGTPFTNRPYQLHPLLTWLQGWQWRDPGQALWTRYSEEWGAFAVWKERYSVSGRGGKYKSGWNLPELHGRLERLVMFRKSFNECASQPKDQRVSFVPVEMSLPESREYAAIMSRKIGEWSGNAIGAKAGMVGAFQYLSGLGGQGGSKLAWLVDKLRYEIDAPCLVLVEWKQGMAAWAGRLAKLTGKRVGMVNGDVNGAGEREGIRRAFQEGKLDVVVMNMVGSVGLDFSAAAYVVVLGKLDWTATRIAQAINRTTSMFKDSAVFVSFLYAPGTIEAWLYQEHLSLKALEFDAVVGGGEEAPSPLRVGTREELERIWRGGGKKAG